MSPAPDLREETEEEEVIMTIRWDNILRVGAWNFRKLNLAGKLQNLKRELQRLNIDIVGVIEVKWREDKVICSHEYRVITTAAENGIMGIGFLMNGKVGQRMSYSEQFSDRVSLTKTDTKPTPTTVV